MSIAGDNIKTRRKQLRMSQSELARLSGVSQDAISDIENGSKTRMPYTDTISKIAAALRCNVGDLMNETEISENLFSPDEMRLLNAVRKLNADGIEKVIEYAKDLSANEKYTQETPAESAI